MLNVSTFKFSFSILVIDSKLSFHNKILLENILMYLFNKNKIQFLKITMVFIVEIKEHVNVEVYQS